MKYTNLIFLIYLITYINITSSLSLTKSNENKFLNSNQPRISLAEMLAQTNTNNLNKLKNENLSSGDQKPMENSGYLFYGYNIFYGNPHSTEGSIDPGFTKPIFRSSYESNKVTGDLRYKLADGSIFAKNVGCDVSLSSSVVKDISSYQKSLEAEVSGGANFGVASFSASASFKAVLSGTSSSEDMYIESKADCRVFTGQLNYYIPPKFDETFIKAIDYIDELDFEKAKDDYFTFIEYFGTHFINKIEMGARYGYLEKVSVKEFSSSSSYSASVSVSGSYGVGSASAKVGASSDQSKSGSNTNKNVKSFSIGVPPPADGNPFTWAEKSLSEPMPISYNVRPLTEIFTNRFFDLSDLKSDKVKIDIPKFAKNINSAMKAYCSEYLKANGKTSFCTQTEFDQLVKNINTTSQVSNKVKIENGALMRIKNKFLDKCITYKGQRRKMQFEPCSKDENQIFKLQYVSSLKAYKVLTNGPLANGQWDYYVGDNRLGIFDYGDDLGDWRAFIFGNESGDIIKIRTLNKPNDCLQAINDQNMDIHVENCKNIQSEFFLSKP